MEEFIIRNAKVEELNSIGMLMVQVYSSLDGFPKPAEQPAYYNLLANVGSLLEKDGTEILVAVNNEDAIAGAVVFFNEMKAYGSGGTATQEKNTAGFRLLAVDSSIRGKGIGRKLAHACILKAGELRREQVIIHTTMAMQTAWKMYERMGFRRSPDLDFMQGELPVYGFRLVL